MHDYLRYLRSDDWPRKRRARLRLDGHRCRLCDSDEELEVHHRPGSYARIPHESVEDDLVTLCGDCHEAVTDRIRRRDWLRTDVPDTSGLDPPDRVRLELASDEPPGPTLLLNHPRTEARCACRGSRCN